MSLRGKADAQVGEEEKKGVRKMREKTEGAHCEEKEEETQEVKEEEEEEKSSAGFQSVRISPLSILTSGP